MDIFVRYPLLAFVLALFFFFSGRHYKSITCKGIGIIWLIYSVYEMSMSTNFWCPGGCNIRVDLLLIYPILGLITLVAAIDIFIKHGKLSTQKPDA